MSPAATAPSKPPAPPEGADQLEQHGDQPAAPASPAAPHRLAIAYTPELIDPISASIPAGSFVLSFISREARVVLNPGLNFDIDPALWEEAKKQPATIELLAIRAIEEIDLGGETIADTAAAGVAAVKHTDEKTALRLIHCSRDQKQLEAWLGLEERQSIRNAITRKIQTLKDGQG